MDMLENGITRRWGFNFKRAQNYTYGDRKEKLRSYSQEVRFYTRKAV